MKTITFSELSLYCHNIIKLSYLLHNHTKVDFIVLNRKVISYDTRELAEYNVDCSEASRRSELVNSDNEPILEIQTLPSGYNEIVDNHVTSCLTA